MIKAGIQDQIDDINKGKDEFIEAKNEEIEALEKSKERWSELSSEIEYANDKAKTSEIFGEDAETWIEKVLHQNGKNDDELFEMTKANREAMTKYSQDLEEQIGDNEFITGMIEKYIEAFNKGEMTQEEFLSQYQSLLSDSKDGLKAQEKLAANLSFGGYETLADSLSEGDKEADRQLDNFLTRFGFYNNRENVDDEKNGIKSISTMLGDLNGLQGESKKIVDEKYAEYLKNQENIGKNVEKIAKHLDDEDDDDDRDEWIEGKSDTGYGAHTSKNSGDRTGWVSEGFRPEHYAEGLANGSVGSGGDKEKFRALQALGLRKLAPDEIPAILHVGEGVVNPKQMSTLLDNVEKAAMNPVGLGAMNATVLPNVTISMGDLTLPNVRNGEEFAKSLQQNFNPIMNQYFSKVFQ